MQLRYYQEEAVNAMINLQKGDRKLLQLPTGSGKTILMAELARRSTGRVLILVQSTELREQTLDKLRMVCGDDIDVGSVQANLNENSAKVIVATRQTLNSCKKRDRVGELLENGDFEYILIDEAHCAVDQQKRILNKLNKDSITIGLTATPYSKDLRKIYDGFVYKKELIDMIQEKYLVEPRCYAVQSSIDISNVKTVGGEYVSSDLDKAINNVERNELIVKAYLEKCNSRKKTIVFANSISHANNIAECFRINGIVAKSVDSTLDKEERKQVLEDFKNGKIPVLVNVNILSIGFDEPSVDSIILARSTKSKMLYIQQLGRGLRLSPNKTDCIVVDIVDNTSRHSLINSKSIFDVKDGETPLEAIDRKKKQSQKEKEEEERRIEEQRKLEEEQERLRLEEIELFNSTVNSILTSSNLDWFTTNINGKQVAVLSSKIDTHYVVRKEENEFKCYLYHNLQNYDYEFTLFDESDNLQELQQNIESLAMNEGSNYINPNAPWKFEKATDKQIKASKGKLKFGDTKWWASRFFTNRSIYFGFKNYKGE